METTAIKIEPIEFSWLTNWNHKMDCDFILHLGFPPKKNLLRTEIEELVFKINTKDGSHEPVLVKIADMQTVSLQHPIPSALTYASHGMSEKEYVDFIFETEQEYLQNSEVLMLFYYQKIKDSNNNC